MASPIGSETTTVVPSPGAVSSRTDPPCAPTFASLACAVGVVASSLPRTPAPIAGGVAAVAVVAGLAGPAAYTWATVGTPHSGALPTAGPAASAGLAAGPRFGRPPGGTFRPNGATPPGPAPGRQFAGPIGGPGGILDATDPSSDIVETLVTDADRYTWIAATVAANQAAGYQLATDRPVMAIGGFNGTDPAPSLARFQALVAAGRVHWFIAGGRGGGPGGGAAIGDRGSASSAITEWVTTPFPSTTVGGVTLYDLSGTA